MRVTEQHLNERKIVDGCLYQRARISVELTPGAMKLFDKRREELRESLGLLRLEWLRFEKVWNHVWDAEALGVTPKYEAKNSISKTDAIYEITLIGSGPMEEPAQRFLDWISMVGRLKESIEPAKPGFRIVIASDPAASTVFDRSLRGTLYTIAARSSMTRSSEYESQFPMRPIQCRSFTKCDDTCKQ